MILSTFVLHTSKNVHITNVVCNDVFIVHNTCIALFVPHKIQASHDSIAKSSCPNCSMI